MKNKPYLSVVIPCYNESENLKRGVLDEVCDFLERQDFSWEIIVSDDGSTDNSRELIRKIVSKKENFRLKENPHAGKPSAVWAGIQEAKGEYILFTDMDQSTPIKEISKIRPFFGKYEVIIGSRGLERKNYSTLRKIGSFAFRNLRKAILLRQINDTQCGFKAFKRQVAKKIFPMLQFFKQKQEVKGWKVTSFDVELLFIAEKLGYRIKEIEVEWEDRDVSKGKQRSYFRESIEMLEQILRVKWNDLRGLYGQQKINN